MFTIYWFSCTGIWSTFAWMFLRTNWHNARQKKASSTTAYYITCPRFEKLKLLVTSTCICWRMSLVFRPSNCQCIFQVTSAYMSVLSGYCPFHQRWRSHFRGTSHLHYFWLKANSSSNDKLLCYKLVHQLRYAADYKPCWFTRRYYTLITQLIALITHQWLHNQYLSAVEECRDLIYRDVYCFVSQKYVMMITTEFSNVKVVELTELLF